MEKGNEGDVVCGGEQTGVNEGEKISGKVERRRDVRTKAVQLVQEGESVVNKSWDEEKTVRVQLEEEEMECLMDVMYALNLQEASSVCVCCPHALKVAF